MRKRNFIMRILLLATVIAIGSLLVFQPNSIGKDKAKQAPAPVQQTRQTRCYENWTIIPCAGTGQDGEYQVGVPWTDQRLIDNGDGTVTDSLTNLMWLKNANCIETDYPGFDNDGDAEDGRVYWEHALDFVAGINDGTYTDCGAGYTDWRLPNVKELLSLIDYGRAVPYALVLPNPFVNTEPIYWSSTSFDGVPTQAWIVRLGTGGVERHAKSLNLWWVWCVRDGD